METTSGVATRSPNPKRETEAQLGLEQTGWPLCTRVHLGRQSLVGWPFDKRLPVRRCLAGVPRVFRTI